MTEPAAPPPAPSSLTSLLHGTIVATPTAGVLAAGYALGEDWSRRIVELVLEKGLVVVLSVGAATWAVRFFSDQAERARARGEAEGERERERSDRAVAAERARHDETRALLNELVRAAQPDRHPESDERRDRSPT